MEETSEVGAACAAGVFGPMLQLPSILGKFKWVRKVGQSKEKDAELESSSFEDCESVLGLDFATQSMYEVGSYS